jgi:cobalt-zinc-cadmium efflux system outer membrane protein
MIRPKALAWAAALALGAPAAAEVVPPDPDAGCDGPLDAARVVRCALAASPEVRQARAALSAAGGRRRTAQTWLPSHPVAAGTVSRRRATGPGGASATNWSATLSQELEVGGQRGLRVEAADADESAQARRLAAAEREVAARALFAYHEALAAREALGLARELAGAGEALASAAEERARQSLLSGVDADVARAEAVRLGLLRLEVERRFAVALATLAILTATGADAGVIGTLAPPSGPTPPDDQLEAEALRLRADLAAAEMERRVLERQRALLQRSRIPNVTLSATAEQDGFAERVLGVGLSVPLPLPGPLGPSRLGEILEAGGRLEAADAAVEQLRRRVRLEVAAARANLSAREQGLALLGDELVARARRDLSALREGVASKQLSLREGLAAQRSLIELLQSSIEARLAHATAWVELRRVVGWPLAGGGR